MNEKDDKDKEEEDDQLLDQLSKIEIILKQKGFTLEEKEKLEKALGTIIKNHKVTKEVEDKDLAELIDKVYEVYKDRGYDDNFNRTIRSDLGRMKKRYFNRELFNEDEKNLRESLINVLSNLDDRRDADSNLFETMEIISES